MYIVYGWLGVTFRVLSIDIPPALDLAIAVVAATMAWHFDTQQSNEEHNMSKIILELLRDNVNFKPLLGTQETLREKARLSHVMACLLWHESSAPGTSSFLEHVASTLFYIDDIPLHASQPSDRRDRLSIQ